MKFHLETRELSADCYLGPNKGRTMLTHAVVVDERGNPIRVVCGRVMLASVCDGGANPLGLTEQPTCRPCRQKTRGMTYGKAREGESQS